ncbi:hypothetical protein NG895_04595 [Aeoliella sp. ICT_H6.2]|uniref:Peptidase M56 domain-containing protein n=1 Tax=Aeoliella straminimaris TaxID=2954799 RepID=A0A9X2F6I9_9BACT|nr:M56 family metallopeptidase [Aeoliella straminimaris]MCO6043175.1 hypothetical protein [Aeoliella straminimaris]
MNGWLDGIAGWSDYWAVVLVHSLWVGAVLAVIVALLLRQVSARRPDLRCGIAYGGLMLTLVGSLAAATLPMDRIAAPRPARSSPGASAQQNDSAHAPTTIVEAQEERSAALATSASAPASGRDAVSWQRILVGLWLVGVALMLVGIGRSHTAARGLVRRASDCHSEFITEALADTTRVLGTAGRVALRLSDEISSPLVYGFHSPIILIPASFASGVPIDTLRVIFAHELWHLRRGDAYFALVQNVVESILFYHPAVWWLSRQVNYEREAACDAAAATVVGEGTRVAAALIETAERGTAQPVAALAAARGFLPDRVQRLLRPNARLGTRVSWGGLVGLAAIGLAAALSLATGTTLVAKEVAVAMTPAQRVEAIEQAMAATEPDDVARIDPRTGQVADNVPRYEVTARLVAADGSPLPRRGSVTVNYQGHSIGLSYRNDSSMSTRLPVGVTFYITPNIEGFAPTQFGPYKMLDSAMDLQELLLTPGYSSRLKIVDSEGQPVEGAKIASAMVWTRIGSGGTGHGVPSLIGRMSDAQGEIELAHLAARPFDITIEKPGYERLRHELAFEPADLTTWKLTPTKPVTGQFVDGAGQPVAGVEVHCVRSEGDSLNSGDPRDEFLERLVHPEYTSGAPLTTADEQGRFELSTLKADAEYWFMALHADHAPTRLDGVQPGQALQQIVLPPRFELHGKLEGDLAKVFPDEGRRNIWFNNPLTYQDMSYSGNHRVEVDGNGNFTLPQLVPGRLSLTIDKQRIDRRIDTSTEDLVIDVDKLGNWGQENYRTVRLRIEGPNNQPVRGTVYLSWRLAEAPDVGRQQDGLWLEIPADDPVLETRVPVGADLWFSGNKLVAAYCRQKNLGKIPPGDGPYDVAVEVQAAGLVIGSVQSASGSPLRDCTVTVRRLERLLQEEDDTLNAWGEFSVGGLPLGDDQYVAQVRLNDTWQIVVSPPFELTKLEPIQELALTMPDPVHLTGQVLQHDGQPAAGRYIGASFSMGGYSHSTGLGKLDDQGRFRIAVSPGGRIDEHEITIRHGGGSTGVTLFYKPDDDRGGHDFGVLKLGPAGTVRGQVLHEGGSPAVGVPVALMADDWEHSEYREMLHDKTDSEGRFEIDGLECVPQKITVAYGKWDMLSINPPALQTTDKYGNPRTVVTPATDPVDLQIVLKDGEE